MSGRHVSVFWISHQRCSMRLSKAPHTTRTYEFSVAPLKYKSKYKLVKRSNALHLAADAAQSGGGANLLFLSCVSLHVDHSQTGVE